MDEKKILEINKILIEARNSISNYCINECKAQCCKKGKLILFNEKEIEFICQGKQKKYLKQKIIQKIKNNNYTYNHQRVKCPHLTNDNKCDDWKNPNRPKVCFDFPLFFSQKKYIITAQICPAVENKLFEKYFEKLKKYEIKII